MNKTFAVVYWLYDDTDTMKVEVFQTREEAEQFEDEIYEACEHKNVSVSVSIEEISGQITVDSALSKLNEVISNNF